MPAEYPDLRAEDPDAATLERDASAPPLEDALAAGRIVAGFDRATSSYVLARAEAAGR